MTAPAVAAVLERVCAVLLAAAVKVGIEAAGHYHRPLLGAGVWPAGWELLGLSPARVAEQRRVLGRRRVKTDAIDLEAITELVLAGHGGAGHGSVCYGHRAHRVGDASQPSGADADGNEEPAAGSVGPLFPGVTLALPDVLGTKIGRLVGARSAPPTTAPAVELLADPGVPVRGGRVDVDPRPTVRHLRTREQALDRRSVGRR